MAKYSWVSLELCDPNNPDDLWDLATVFEETSLSQKANSIENCPFIFLIQKYEKEEGEYNYTCHNTKGVILLTQNKLESHILNIYCETRKEDRQKGYMDFALFILNHKQIGNTTEQDPKIIAYEQNLKNFQIIASVEKEDPIGNKLFQKHGNILLSEHQKNYYDIGFEKQKGKQLYK